MDNTWIKILVFTILAVVLGFILGRVTGGHHGPHHRGSHECAPEKAHQGIWIDKEGTQIRIQTDDVSDIVDDIEESDFEGDTTITAGGASIKINKDGGEIKVNVEMEDDGGNKKTVEKKIMIIKDDDDN